MAFQAAPQCVEVVLKMNQNTIPAVNVWNVDVGATVTDGILASVRDLFDEWITDTFSPQISNTVALAELIVTDISVEGGHQVTMAPTTPTGAATGQSVPANVALVASFRTSRIGRAYRGRSYTTGLVVGHLADAHSATTTHADAVGAAFVTLIDALTDAGYKLVVLSRFLNKVQRVVAVATEIIQVITNVKLDSQRRRTAN